MSQNTTDIVVKARADADACRDSSQNYTASRFDDLIDEITELRNRNANQAVTIHEHQQACVAAGLDPLLGCGKCITAQADIITRLREDKRLLLAEVRRHRGWIYGHIAALSKECRASRARTSPPHDADSPEYCEEHFKAECEFEDAMKATDALNIPEMKE